jgi:hypothetical protein
VKRHRAEFGIQQLDTVSGLQERTTEAQQTERWQVFAGNAAADGGMRWIEEEEFHGMAFFRVSIYFVSQSV